MTVKTGLRRRTAFSLSDDLRQIIFCCDEIFRLHERKDYLIPIAPRDKNPELDHVSRTLEAVHDCLCIRVRGLMTNSIRNDGKITGRDPLEIEDNPEFKKVREWASQDIAHTNFKNRKIVPSNRGAKMSRNYLYPGTLREVKRVSLLKLQEVEESNWGDSEFQ